MNFLTSSLNGGITSNTLDVLLTVFLVLFTIVVTFIGVYVIATNVNRQNIAEKGGVVLAKNETGFNVSHVVLLIIILGATIRIIFALLTNGFLGTNPSNLVATNNRNGLVQYYAAMRDLFAGQPLGVHAEGIYPVPFLFLTIFGGIASLFGPIVATDPNIATQLLFRMPFIIFDLATAMLLYFAAKKYANQRVGLGLVIIYALSPIFFFSSGIWGSMFSILAFFIVLSLYFMADRNFIGLTIAFSFALLSGRDAMLFSPVILVFLGYHFVKAIKAIKADKQRAEDLKKVRGRKAVKAEEEIEVLNKKKSLIFEKDKGLAIRIPLYFIGALVGMYILSLPLLGPINFNPLRWFSGLFITPFASGMQHVTTNGMTIYNLFGRNNRPVSDAVPPAVYSILFFIVAIALVLTIYISKKNRANLVLVASYLVFTLSIFYMDFSELNLIVVLAGLLLAFIFIKDKRILQVFMMLSVTVLINASLVMMSAGYFGNMPLSYYSGSYATTQISEMGGAMAAAIVMNLILTALTLLIFVYKSFIILDITLANTRKPFVTKQREVLPVLRDFIKFRKK
ncbi:MAG: hypothetical protein FWE03_00945 [Firmicutes bacterium]|nr:hypothetical protein [Bacillota bacterium]